MIVPPEDYRKEIVPYRVFFNWEITYRCNYKCSYCVFGGAATRRQSNYSIENITNFSVSDIINSWEKIFESYKSCHIHLAGGEPFIYPNIFEILEEISKIHTWECSTNFFFDPENLIKRIPPDRVRLGLSFHPEFTTFETFFLKTKILKEAGYEVWVNYVAYPPYIHNMEFYKEKFAEIGIVMSILPFKGEYRGRQYPESYNEDEKNLLKKLGVEPWIKKTLEFFTEKQDISDGRLCRMGQMYAKIRPNGDAYHCCVEGGIKLGNLFDNTIRLLDEP
ncbi:MAG: radical SAM protein, partial [Candidatus Micrarchaeia archaeon]